MRLQTTKSVQNAPKMAQNGPCGPFRARQGPFWVIFGTILELRCQQHSQRGSMVLKWKPLRIVFVLCWLYFRHFLVFWVFWGLLEPFWRPFGGIWSPFLDLLATILAYPEPFLDLLAYRCGKVPPTRGCCPSLGPFGPIWAVRFPLFDV